MIERKYTEEASRFCRAIERLAARPANMDNFELYLSLHFSDWLKKMANTPEDISFEVQFFADMDI